MTISNNFGDIGVLPTELYAHKLYQCPFFCECLGNLNFTTQFNVISCNWSKDLSILKNLKNEEQQGHFFGYTPKANQFEFILRFN